MKLFSNDLALVLFGLMLVQPVLLAEEGTPSSKIVHLTLDHDSLALVKVGINGVTSLEFPYKIEAIDGYGFSATPGSADLFQLSYTKGTNYLSIRALKPGAKGNLTVVLDQKIYSILFEENSDPSFANIFTLPAEKPLVQSAAPNREAVADVSDAEPLSQSDWGLSLKEKPKELAATFDEPANDGLPTSESKNGSKRVEENSRSEVPFKGTSVSTLKHTARKKPAKKDEPDPAKTKDALAKTQKPERKKLFGWL